MEFDFSPYFKRYEVLAQAADKVFERLCKEYPDCVTCEVGCSDCCHALFDLTLIESLYINQHFKALFQGKLRADLQEAANSADRKIAKIKREAFRRLQNGEDENTILADLATCRVRCPLLNEEDQCDMYAYRPLTCRFYGVPTAIDGKGHTCGRSGFVQGTEYPTVNLDTVYQQLQQISSELLRDMRASHIKLVDLLIPVSMALITLFDDEYFGIEYPQPDTAGKK